MTQTTSFNPKGKQTMPNTATMKKKANAQRPTPNAQRPTKRPGFTPGPWTIDRDNGDAAAGARPNVIIETEDRHIAFCFDAGDGKRPDVQAVADYNLIAAAPDLYEAAKLFDDLARGYLIRIVSFKGNQNVLSGKLAEAKEAISRAVQKAEAHS
jgi:hypothetical protein